MSQTDPVADITPSNSIPEPEQPLEESHWLSDVGDWLVNNTFSKLFFRRKFIAHRLNGLFYLIQYVLAIYLYMTDYPTFYKSPLIWTLPLTGLIQAIVAVYTFTFLPKGQADPGYFSDKSILSYNFIKENMFFELLLFFPWVYYHDSFYRFFKATVVLEAAFVFFPYYIRSYFPKTRMRDSLSSEKNKTEKNRVFFTIATYITKLFYIWAKHYIGYFLNYARYLDRLTANEQEALYMLLIASSFATTISLFLHTLKFKGYMGPVKAYVAYMASYIFTFYAFYKIFHIFFEHWDLFAIAFVGVLLNFADRKVQYAYQVLVFAMLSSMRYGYFDPSLNVFVI